MPAPLQASLPDPGRLTPPLLVEIGFFDEDDTPEETLTVPLSRYLAELMESASES